jgi:hypothetical protein
MVIFPKLYRRLVNYFAANHIDLGAFHTWLRASARQTAGLAVLEQASGERGGVHRCAGPAGHPVSR